jgi:hypothetical protein
MKLRVALGLLVALLALPCPAEPCSICNVQGTTLRQDAQQAKMILYGPLVKSRVGNDGLGGTSDFQIDKVIKNDPFLAGRKMLELPRFVPVDPKNPEFYLVFCDIFNNKLDPYRGVKVASPAIVEYLQGAMALDPKNTEANLLFFFKYVDHKDANIAQDAFLELARAGDKEMGQVASKFPPAKLRTWLQDPALTADRLNLFGLMLGACGTDRDAVLLNSFLKDPTDRNLAAYQGVLSGYIQLRPREGWDLVYDVLRDAKKPFLQRYAVIRTMRFYQGWKPQESKREVMKGLTIAVEQGDVADLAIEDLRRWEIWDLTPSVLAQFGKKSHEAPIVKRCIVRYGLSCPRPEAREFIARLRKQDAELVQEVEESLRLNGK